MDRKTEPRQVTAGPLVVASVDCASAVELIELLDPNFGAFDDHTVYRGHGNDDWTLTPSLFRESQDGLRPGSPWHESECLGKGSKEIDLLLNFVQEADRRGFEIPGGGADHALRELRSFFRTGWGTSGGDYVSTDLLSALALAQHSGVPTRLLDWTSSPWVAAYFAARDHLKEKERPRYLSIWTTRKQTDGIWEMNSNQSFLINGEPLCTVRFEVKLSFLPVSGSGNPNLRAQSGELMYPSVRTHIDPLGMSKPEYRFEFEKALRRTTATNIEGLIQKMIDGHEGENLVNFERPFIKLRLRSQQAPVLLRLLDRYGISGSAIYPGLAGAADSAKERTLYGGYGVMEETHEDVLRKEGSRLRLLQMIQSPSVKS